MSYPTWIYGKTPHTDSKARPNRSRNVSGVCAIEVEGARYRSSTALNGIFEIFGEPAKSVKTHPSGKVTAEVICSWHGVKPKSCYPHITLKPGKYKIIQGYAGEVIDNIG